MKSIVIGLLVAGVVGLFSLSHMDSELLKMVKSGEASLQCHIGEGYVKIDPSMVVDFYPDQGYWKFINGGSKSCQVNRNDVASR